MTRTARKMIQLRLSETGVALIDELVGIYNLDRSTIIRAALAFSLEAKEFQAMLRRLADADV